MEFDDSGEGLVSGANRLHPMSVLFGVIRSARMFLLPGLLVLFFSRGDKWQMWAMLLLIPAACFEILRYFTLRYRVDHDEIVVREGIFFKNERHIPFHRIQNIDLVQNPLHRLFRVAEVNLETASGSKPEAVFKVLSLRIVKEMRARVFRDRGVEKAFESSDDPIEDFPPPAPTLEEDVARSTVPPQPAKIPLLEVKTSDLVRLGLINNKGWAMLLAMMAVIWEFNLDDRLWKSSEWETYWNSISMNLAVLFVVGIVMVGIPLLYGGSIVWTIFRFHGFKIIKSGEDLRLSCGLLTRRSAAVPLHRIQLVSLHETFLMRRLRQVSVRVETAGGGEEEKGSISRRWFVPLMPRFEVGRLLESLRPELDLDQVPWQSLPEEAEWRLKKKGILLSLVFTGLVSLLVRPWGGFSLLVFMPLMVWYCGRYYRSISFARTDYGIFYRSGVFTLKTSVTFFSKMQVVGMSQSPFDRRYSMASLKVDTAGSGPAGHKIHIPYIPETLARSLFNDLSKKTQESAFQW